jgi:hypothetical protein
MPGAPFEFDELSACEVLRDEMCRHVTPAQAGFEEVVFCAHIVEKPLTPPRHIDLSFLRFGLVVSYDKLNMSAELLKGNWL